MENSIILDAFDSWKITKALSHRERVARIAEIMKDKTAQDITFTSIDSKGNLTQHLLGSVQGNLAFLLGKVNPGFHVAPYHFQVMDPTLEDREAKEIYKIKGHPAIPAMWEAHSQIPFQEGDLANGKPHPDAFVVPQKDPTFVSNVDGRKYYANPLTQLVESVETGHVYAWSLVRNTYLSSQDPNLVEKMDNFVPGVFDARPKDIDVPGEVKDIAKAEIGDWDKDVYPLVKSLFPVPGSIIKIDEGYAVIGQALVYFFKKDGRMQEAVQFDYDSSALSLKKGESQPSCIINFATHFLNKDLSQYV